MLFLMWVFLLFVTQFTVSDGANLVTMACRFDPTLPYCAKSKSVPASIITSPNVNSHSPTFHSEEKYTLCWPESDDTEELFSGYSTHMQTDSKNPADPKKKSSKAVKTVNRAYAVPVVPTDARYSAGGDDAFKAFDQYTDSRGVLHRPKSSSPFSKPGLWEPNPADPHSRDPANKYWYHPESVGVDWLNGQLQWGAHWAVPAAGIGGTDGMSTLHFPSIGTFLNIPDDYD